MGRQLFRGHAARDAGLAVLGETNGRRLLRRRTGLDFTRRGVEAIHEGKTDDRPITSDAETAGGYSVVPVVVSRGHNNH
uniref:Modification methylase n=1 Tax=uncultured marine virus TaxID=186617 RepID=A0A0F7L973_9VIRU|nr:modification methylase [uncultured marine virus]